MVDPLPSCRWARVKLTAPVLVDVPDGSPDHMLGLPGLKRLGPGGWPERGTREAGTLDLSSPSACFTTRPKSVNHPTRTCRFSDGALLGGSLYVAGEPHLIRLIRGLGR